MPEFAYLAQLDDLTATPSSAKTVDEFLTMDHIETLLAVRAAYKIHEVRAEMNKSDAHKKQKENEIFAIDIGQVSRMHLIYLSFKLAR